MLQFWPYALVALAALALAVVVVLLMTTGPEPQAAARKAATPGRTRQDGTMRRRVHDPATSVRGALPDNWAAPLREGPFARRPPEVPPDSVHAAPGVRHAPFPVSPESGAEPGRLRPALRAARQDSAAIRSEASESATQASQSFDHPLVPGKSLAGHQPMRETPAAPTAAPFDIPTFLRRKHPPGSEVPAPTLAEATGKHRLLRNPGKLIYNPPARMRALLSQTITVRIVGNVADEAALQSAFVNLRGAAPARSQPIDTTASMSVQLYGPHEAFRIEQRSPLLQVLDTRRGFAEWIFVVTPLVSGTHELELVVAGCRSLSGQLEADDQESVVVKIKVRVNHRALAARTLRAVAGAAGIALVTWLVTVNADAIRDVFTGSISTPEAREP